MELTASPTLTSRERTRPSMGLTMVELRKSSRALSSEACAWACWRFGFGDFRARNGEIALRAHLFVQGKLIVLLGVFDNALGHNPVLKHLVGAVHAEFQERNVRPFGVNLVAFRERLMRIPWRR